MPSIPRRRLTAPPEPPPPLAGPAYWRYAAFWCFARYDRLDRFDRVSLELVWRSRRPSPYMVARLYRIFARVALLEADNMAGTTLTSRAGTHLTPASPGFGKRHFTLDHAPAGVPV